MEPTVVGENRFCKIVLWPLPTRYGMHAPLPPLNKINLLKNNFFNQALLWFYEVFKLSPFHIGETEV